MTHTHAILEVSPRTYREIRDKLEAAGYADQFHSKLVSGVDAEVIDLHGLALVAGADRTGPGAPFLATGSVWRTRDGRRFTVRSVRDGFITLSRTGDDGEEVFTEHSLGEFCPTPEFPKGFHGYRFVPAGPQS